MTDRTGLSEGELDEFIASECRSFRKQQAALSEYIQGRYSDAQEAELAIRRRIPEAMYGGRPLIKMGVEELQVELLRLEDKYEDLLRRHLAQEPPL